jgi:hypothetical protein
MRVLIALASVLGLLCSAPAHSDISSILVPSPVTIALSIGKWIYDAKTDEQVYYIQVSATAHSEEEARKQAFRYAVDQAIGSLLVSETKIKNQNIESHDVINYSSGYIHDFKYISKDQNENGTELVIDVWVKRSKIAERIALDSRTESQIQGGRIGEAFRSLEKESKTGDKLLQLVLNDYPHKAYQSNITNLEFVYQDRKPVLLITFDVFWNQEYANSLEEVMQNIGSKAATFSSNYNVYFNRERCILCSNTKFNVDPVRVQKTHDTFHTPMPMIQVKLLDTAENVVHKDCVYYGNLQGQDLNSLWLISRTGFTVNVDRYIQNTLTYHLSGLDIDSLDKVQLSFVRHTSCN